MAQVLRYVKSGRYDKKLHRPVYALCPNCGESMYAVRVDSSKHYHGVYYNVKAKYCISCNTLKILDQNMRVVI